MADYLNSYGVLKSYVDRSRHPALKLGIGLPANDLTEGTGLNSLVITNADEAVTTSGLGHKDIIGNDGTVGAYAVTDLVPRPRMPAQAYSAMPCAATTSTTRRTSIRP